MLHTNEHRPSVQLKHSFCSESGTICQPKVSVCGRLSEQYTAPPKTRIISTGGQVFLCVLGSMISVSICIWLAIFSSDLPWRRMLFSAGAALCALMFAMLAFTSMRRVVNPAPELIPNLAHRRSTIQKLRKNTATHVVIDSADQECHSSGSADHHHQHASLIGGGSKRASMNNA
ncbi:hypothetical protein QR680_003140 [Steinernema hermaphroditum]|uniref:Uncharacterized protein n=1 Tax=Steinernema hermaphroditum TaxID=289476 RepID=A0AA39H7Q3_9BILA|nr:hypothetical protein QR680_003140 [Steinernema hermaphroditum]